MMRQPSCWLQMEWSRAIRQAAFLPRLRSAEGELFFTGSPSVSRLNKRAGNIGVITKRREGVSSYQRHWEWILKFTRQINWSFFCSPSFEIILAAAPSWKLGEGSVQRRSFFTSSRAHLLASISVFLLCRSIKNFSDNSCLVNLFSVIRSNPQRENKKQCRLRFLIGGDAS